MFEVDGPKILSNGLEWCPWLTLMLTPAMLNGLVAELNEAREEGKTEGYDDGHSDGYDEGYSDGDEYATEKMNDEQIEGHGDEEKIEGIN